RACDLPILEVDQRVSAIADNARRPDLALGHRFAEHRLDGIPPHSDHARVHRRTVLVPRGFGLLARTSWRPDPANSPTMATSLRELMMQFGRGHGKKSFSADAG